MILEELHYPSERAREICRIILGHDSRKKPVSRSDLIVKDSNKLFWYSRKGVDLLLNWFPDLRGDIFNLLEKQIEEWFFLATSRKLARQELVRRKKGANRS